MTTCPISPSKVAMPFSVQAYQAQSPLRERPWSATGTLLAKEGISLDGLGVGVLPIALISNAIITEEASHLATLVAPPRCAEGK